MKNGQEINAKYRAAESIAHREIEGQTLLLLPNSHVLYTFNESGKFVWNRILKKQSVAKIITDFAREFGLEKDRAEADVKKLLRELLKKGVIIAD
ncbi:MAG TPA: PqqD family protein [Blastocatellia bacterium]|nr:PqqD family protein [Blastocatellia bacterium]